MPAFSYSNDEPPCGNFNLNDSQSITQWLTRFRLLAAPSQIQTYPMIHISVVHQEEGRSWLDTLKSSNYKILENCEMDDWDEIEPDTALEKISQNLHESQAYSIVIMNKDIANSWARSFIESLTAGGVIQWYRNDDQVTENTFDFCVVGVDTVSNSIGYLLITDED